MVSINQRLDAEVLTLIGEEYGFDINFIDAKETELELEEEEDDPEPVKPKKKFSLNMRRIALLFGICFLIC